MGCEDGRGREAAKDFFRAGGTHLFLVSKPSWSLGVNPSDGADYAAVFDETLRVAEMIRPTGIVVFPVLGVHPAEISRLTERMPLTEATALMKAGLDVAAAYVQEGKAVALKSGRPHYEVSPELLAASNDVLTHALRRAAGIEERDPVAPWHQTKMIQHHRSQVEDETIQVIPAALGECSQFLQLGTDFGLGRTIRNHLAHILQAERERQ